jgi:hypothetical protein
MTEPKPFTCIRAWLYIGNRNVCGVCPANICLHINRSDRPDKDCCRSQTPYSKNFEIDHQDGELLSDEAILTLSTLIKDLRYNRRQTLLVHCNAGGCRSPMIAAYVWAMIDEDVTFLEALYGVEKAVYAQQNKLCNIVYKTKHQLMSHWATWRNLRLPKY